MPIQINGSTGVVPQSWTTATRPTGLTPGQGGWNSTINSFEIFLGNGRWQAVASEAYTIEYLIVAGGGSGGVSTYGGQNGAGAGGGGAGGLLTGVGLLVVPGTSYSILVGAGGAAVTNAVGSYYQGLPGSNSSAFSLTAIGGGSGGGGGAIGGSGGSGGGSGWGNTSPSSGTLGQGNAGGPGQGNVAPYWGGAGGGAGAAGTNAGVGGVGLASSITGSSQFYGGGGGPTDVYGTARAGGSGGGGASGLNGTSGQINTGGGGGAGSSGGATSGAGGSGVVIVRYLGTTQRATGGIVTLNGGYVIHTFNSSGTFVA